MKVLSISFNTDWEGWGAMKVRMRSCSGQKKSMKQRRTNHTSKYSKSPTYEPSSGQTFKDVNVHSPVQPPKLVLSEEALIAFETQELNIEWYTSIVTAFLPQ